MNYRKKNPIYKNNETLMNLLDIPAVYPHIIVVPREMEPFELDHMVFLLNII
jgi:diadenosine tetraphosphate (Ap4A) HIT family hydrolase